MVEPKQTAGLPYLLHTRSMGGESSGVLVPGVRLDPFMTVRHMPDWLLPVRPSASTGWVPFASPKPQDAENLFANLPEHPSLLLFSYISRLSGPAQKHQQGARTMYPKALPRALHSCRPGSMSTLKVTM